MTNIQNVEVQGLYEKVQASLRSYGLHSYTVYQSSTGFLILGRVGNLTITIAYDVLEAIGDLPNRSVHMYATSRDEGHSAALNGLEKLIEPVELSQDYTVIKALNQFVKQCLLVEFDGGNSEFSKPVTKVFNSILLSPFNVLVSGLAGLLIAWIVWSAWVTWMASI